MCISVLGQRVIGGTLQNGIDNPADCIERCMEPCGSVSFQISTSQCFFHNIVPAPLNFVRRQAALPPLTQVQNTACEHRQQDLDFIHYRKTICTPRKFTINSVNICVFLLYFQQGSQVIDVYNQYLKWIYHVYCLVTRQSQTSWLASIKRYSGKSADRGLKSGNGVDFYHL